MFKLTFETSNAAFAEDDATDELARILREVAGRIQNNGEDQGRVRDVNGNDIGYFEWVE